MKVRLAALTIWITIALTLSCAIAPITFAQTIASPAPGRSVEQPAAPHESFFTLGRDALNFSKFAQRDRSASPTENRKSPQQIIENIRQRHRGASSRTSTKEKIQQLKIKLLSIKLPEQSRQLRDRINELPHRVKESVSQTTTSLRNSAIAKSQDYLQKTKSQPLLVTIQARVNWLKQRLKKLAVSVLEQASYQIDSAADQLKN